MAHDVQMANQPAHDGTGSELTRAVAARLRGRFAEQRIRQKEVMIGCGWSKTTAYRKMNGYSPLDTDELNRLWQVFGVSPVFLLTGDPDNRPYPGGDPGGDQVSERSTVQSCQGAQFPRRTALRLVSSTPN